MSDHVAHSYHDCEGTSMKSTLPYQSVWMAHWTQTRCRTAPQANSGLTLNLENNEDAGDAKKLLLSGKEVAPDIARSAEGFGNAGKTKTFRFTNEGTSTKNSVNNGIDLQLHSMSNHGGNIKSGSTLKDDLDPSFHRLALRLTNHEMDHNPVSQGTTASKFPSVPAAAPATETSSRERLFELQTDIELVNNHKVLDNSLALAVPSLQKFTGPTHVMPSTFNRGKCPVLSSVQRQKGFDHLGSTSASEEHFSKANFTILEHNHHSHATFLLCEEKVGDNSTSGKSTTSFLKQRNRSLFLCDPSSSNSHLPLFVGQRYQKVQNLSGIGFFSSPGSSQEAVKSEKLCQECYSLQGTTHCIHDETLRICTATDSVEGLDGRPSRFSQTTHGFLLTKETDGILCREDQTFRESKGNMFSELFKLSSAVARDKGGVKLQSLSSSSDSEGKGNLKDVKTSELCFKKESSAETDTMDMDVLREENSLSGVNSSMLNKDTLLDESVPSEAPITEMREEAGCKWSMSRLPDINEELPALPAMASSMEKAEASASRTESLDAEHLLSHAKQPIDLQLSPYEGSPPMIDPSSRWLKRLKLSASDSLGVGTRSSILGEPSSHQKANKLFTKIMGSTMQSISKPNFDKYVGEQEMVNKTAVLSGNDGSTPVESAKRGRDMLLSHTWIRRWCRNQAVDPLKKPEADVICEPQTLKLESEELQNKQFPSIAAMALMGKAMASFQPCQFQRKGSYMVWNTKAF